jgi:hypothetical protein
MRFSLMVAAMAATMVSASASASVLYTFSTIEPFTGGALSFSYDASDFLNDDVFVQRNALTNVVGNIDRVRFDASCPSASGAAACDQLTVFSGITSVYRYFGNYAFSHYGSSVAAFGAAATLTVAPAASGAVPEPATWAMMILGMGAVGYAMRRSIKVSEVNFTKKVRAIAAS